MKIRTCLLLFLALLIACACPWNDELREYLNARFWLPFAKNAATFEKPDVPRMNAPFAGMQAVEGNSPLARLRHAYQDVSNSNAYLQSQPLDQAPLRAAVTAARADRSLTRREREEVDLVEAKIEMRLGEVRDSDDSYLRRAEQKFQIFLHTARTPAFRSEARGWLAHIHYLFGEQTAAGKMYLDELNRAGSNLSRKTLLNSLQMTYGYDGGPEFITHLDEYFDTPEHAAFAIQLITNPHWHAGEFGRFAHSPDRSRTYQHIKDLLASHEWLLRSTEGADTLGSLAMRVALNMGDPAGARKISESTPASAAIRASPDFQWMSASALFLSRDYSAAEKPLLALFRSSRATIRQKAAAAYGLCGVYSKTGNTAEQLRFALWLHTANRGREYLPTPSGLSDLSIYWASSGWDLNLLLDDELSAEALRSFVDQNPNLAGIRLVKYSLAVRLSRQDQYQEGADLYRSIHANRRAQRLQELALLSQAAERPGMDTQQKLRSRYELASFIGANPDRIYFNDALWYGMQRYALQASNDYRLTRAERTKLMAAERELKDSQEERWRAYLLLRDVVHDAGTTDLGRDAAKLALRCLRGINTDRFGRQGEIRRADTELSAWLRKTSK